MSETSPVPTHHELEDLFVNNEQLERLESFLGRFNPIRIMRMENMEIRHSAILAWLLDPQESHGLGDNFLKAFLGEVLRGQDPKHTQISALDLIKTDLRDAEVRCEWVNIDIFIHCPSQNWAFVIENKYWSRQRDGQLSRYVRKVERIYGGTNVGRNLVIQGIFLTQHKDELKKPEFATIEYVDICGILDRLLSQHDKPINENVRIFLNHYLEIIREATGMSKEQNDMKFLAKSLYRSHKKVLDYVIRHGAVTDFGIAVESVFGQNRKYGDAIVIEGKRYTFNNADNAVVSFLPESWLNALGGAVNKTLWPNCQGYWAGYPLICWLGMTEDAEGSKGTLRLYAEVGPIMDYSLRSGLIERLKSLGAEHGLSIGFQRGATGEGKKYSRFFKNNKFKVTDIHDEEIIEKVMRDLLRKFHAEFDAIAPVLEEWRKTVEESNHGA